LLFDSNSSGFYHCINVMYYASTILLLSFIFVPICIGTAVNSICLRTYLFYLSPLLRLAGAKVTIIFKLARKKILFFNKI
jgi:hypothetical protein